MMDQIQTLPAEARALAESLQSWIDVQKTQGFETKMHQALVDAIIFKPSIMIVLWQEIQTRKGQNTSDIASNIYPLEAALRFIAQCLSVNDWNSRLVIETVDNHHQELVELAATRTMAKNLPLRAGFMLDLINQSNSIDPKRPLQIIELGASAGLISTGLTQSQQFIEWFSQQKAVDSKVKQINSNLPHDIQAISIDLVPPELNWVLACMDNDLMRQITQDFITRFPNRTPVVQGNALNFREIIKSGGILEEKAQFLVIVSMFLYQLPTDARTELMKQLHLFSQEKDALILFADLFNTGPQTDGWFAWIENSANIVSPVIQLHEEPIFSWQETEFLPDKQLTNFIKI